LPFGDCFQSIDEGAEIGHAPENRLRAMEGFGTAGDYFI
jgi:hypothetical protein